MEDDGASVLGSVSVVVVESPSVTEGSDTSSTVSWLVSDDDRDGE